MVSKSQNLLISEQRDIRPSFSPSSNPSHKFTDAFSNHVTYQQSHATNPSSRDSYPQNISQQSRSTTSRMTSNALMRLQLTILVLAAG